MENQERKWIQQCLDGDASAFDALYHAHCRRVKGYLLRSGFSSNDADDLTQETFLRVYRSLHTFDPDRGKFRYWLSTIAKNVARKQWARRAQPDSFDPELAEEMFAGTDNPHHDAADAEELAALSDCIGKLPDQLQQVVHLRFVQGLTTRGVAAEMGMAEATVRLRLQTARGLLSRCLGDKGVLE